MPSTVDLVLLLAGILLVLVALAGSVSAARRGSARGLGRRTCVALLACGAVLLGSGAFLFLRAPAPASAAAAAPSAPPSPTGAPAPVPSTAAGASQPGSAGATSAPPIDPRQVAQLMAHVPPRDNVTCSPMQEGVDLYPVGATVAVGCLGSAGAVPDLAVYGQFPTTQAMNGDFMLWQVSLAQDAGRALGRGECSSAAPLASMPLQGAYTVGGQPRGQLLCDRLRQGVVAVVWTDETLDISVAAIEQHPEHYAAALDFWRTGGPV